MEADEPVIGAARGTSVMTSTRSTDRLAPAGATARRPHPPSALALGSYGVLVDTDPEPQRLARKHESLAGTGPWPPDPYTRLSPVLGAAAALGHVPIEPWLSCYPDPVGCGYFATTVKSLVNGLFWARSRPEVRAKLGVIEGAGR